MEKRRPLLLQALNDIYRDKAGDSSGDALDAEPEGDANVPAKERGRATAGHVSIVGAGPGDPGLLTRRAAARLRTADLVLYDALVDPRVLRLARRAQRFFVGKRAGRHAMSQTAINGLMVRAARRGKQVVRLKGGDPFVFGRGGEEMHALMTAGLTWDMIPGVSSATAAPGLAGIPVTHRGVSSTLLIVGGYDEAGFRSAAGGVRPGTATLVVLMGLGRRASLAGHLIELGWLPDTPAAIVVNASRADQHVWSGTLEELAADAVNAIEGAGTIVIGHVVGLAPRAGADRISSERTQHVSR
jgi:uroporphyrin-III C-methyltransferase/precorrin-2 dehydrogenase/sirohydrochlorin ferrochelatase